MKRKLRYLIIVVLFVTGSGQAHGQYHLPIDTLWKNLEQLSDDRSRFYAYDAIGLNLYYHYGNADTLVKSVCDSMLAIGKRLGSDSLLSRGHLLMGVYYGYTGEHDKVIENLRTAIDKAKKRRYWDGLSAAYKEYAIFFKDLGADSNALEKLKQAEKVLPQIPDRLHAFQPNRLYYNMADVYCRLGKQRQAMEYNDKARANTDRITDPYGHIRVLDMYGKIYGATGDVKLAESHFDEAIAFCDSTQLYYPLVTVSLDYCRLLLSVKKLAEAEKCALKGLTYAKLIANKRKMTELLDILKKICWITERPDLLARYAWECDSIRALMENEQATNQLVICVKNDTKQDVVEEQLAESRELRASYVLLSIIVVIAVTLFLALSSAFMINKKRVVWLTNLAFLMFFEFLNLIIHQLLHGIHPFMMFMILLAVSSVLLPVHHRLQKKITLQLVRNNRLIRKRNAEKTLKEIAEQGDNDGDEHEAND
jgi:tetratricopeptide (TPR) repeat protein